MFDRWPVSRADPLRATTMRLQKEMTSHGPAALQSPMD
jgi:hypothetical protein